jgi:hypothetical protein
MVYCGTMNAQGMAAPNANREQSLVTVRSALARSRRAMVVLAVFVLGLGGLGPLGLDESSTTGQKALYLGFTCFMAVVAVVLLWVGLVKNSPSRSPLMLALRDRPDDVVWIYMQDVNVTVDGIAAPVRDANVIANLRDGSTVAITVNKSNAAAVHEALAALAPRAAIGFSDERQAQYKRDPGSLAGTGAI